MKSPGYFEHLRHVSQPVFPRTAAQVALLLVLLVMPACTTFQTDQPQDAFYNQIYTDMMYGADDYFGWNNDLAYADNVVPTVVQPKVAVVVQPVYYYVAPPPPTTGGGGGGPT